MTHKLLRIAGDNQFKALMGLTLNNRAVDIVGCGDIHPFQSPPLFAEAHDVFIRNCDKNFVFYWLKPSIFPKVKNIYLSSHPCEPSIFCSFLNNDQEPAGPIFHLNYTYSIYKSRWATNLDNVVLITNSEIEQILNDYI